MSNTAKNVTIRITDQTGHTTLNQNVDEAYQTIENEHFNAGRWVFVGSQAFQFTASSQDDVANLLQDAARLKALLETADNAEVTLTGDLVGGAIVVAVAITGKDEEEWDQDRISELVQSIKDQVGADSVSVETDNDYFNSEEEVDDEPETVTYEFPRYALENASDLLAQTIDLKNFVDDQEDGVRVEVVVVD